MGERKVRLNAGRTQSSTSTLGGREVRLSPRERKVQLNTGQTQVRLPQEEHKVRLDAERPQSSVKRWASARFDFAQGNRKVRREFLRTRRST